MAPKVCSVVTTEHTKIKLSRNFAAVKLRILHLVQSYWPSVGGMQEVVRQLSERLVAAGHEVTVVCSAHPNRTAFTHNGVHIVAFDVQGLPIRGLTGEVETYITFLRNSQFDMVTCFAAQHWATDLALPILKEIAGKKVFVPTGFSGLFNPAYADYYEKMKTWMNDFDANVFLSDDYRDIQFARKHGITKNHLIPNGAAEDEFYGSPLPDLYQNLALPKDKKLLLHVGSFTGFKGQETAVEIFARAQHPSLQGASLLLVVDDEAATTQKIFGGLKGWLLKRKLKKNQRNVLIKTLTRPETVAAYHAADVFLFPSWIECSPIVLFECMATRTPFLVTDVGNSKEIISWSKAGQLLPTTFDKHGYSHTDATQAAQVLDAFMANEQAQVEAAESGYAIWKKRFTWEQLAKDYEALYVQLIHTTNA